MPPNDVVTTTLNFPSQFTWLAWVFTNLETGVIYYRNKDNYNYIIVEVSTTTGGNIGIGMETTGIYQGKYQGVVGFSNFYSAQWNFIAMVIGATTLNVYVNNVMQLTIALPVVPYVETGVNFGYIGSYDGVNYSFWGFLWYFAVINDTSSYTGYMTTVASSNCLTVAGSCTLPCTPAVVDPYAGTGCISNLSYIFYTAAGVVCPSSSTVACVGSTLLNCDCSTRNSCIISNAASVCYCPPTYFGNATACITCNNACATCTQANICTTCIAANSSPDSVQGCNCNLGYYGTKPLTTSTSCTACYLECSNCTVANTCTSCIAANSSPNTGTNIGCLCNAGYWGTSPLSTSSSCTACYLECATCNQTSLCLTCKASHASPSTTIGCLCNSGYWGTAPLSSSTSCSTCNSVCLTCNSSTTCLTCLANNASPSTSNYCACNAGFWGTAPLSLSTSCTPCFPACATCNQTSVCLTCKSSNATPNSGSGCSCNAGYWGTPPLIQAGSCTACYVECATCSQANVCLTCKAANSTPNTGTGCSCNTGYWGLAPLSASTSCAVCYTECNTCNQANTCLTCKASNSTPNAGTGCTCDAGYWGTAPLSLSTSCTVCYTECATCSQANTCLTCIAANSTPNSGAGCSCKAGYWGTAPLSLSTSCTICYQECATCNQSNVCLTCVALNAVANAVQGCACSSGYWGLAPLSLSNSCTACYSECATCTQANTCSACISSNASPNTGTGCSCNAGYWGVSPLSASTSCTLCNSACATCTAASTCLTCVAANSSPIAGSYCVCNAGYWGVAPLSSLYACTACRVDCATCNSANACLTCIAANAGPNTATNVGCMCSAGFWGAGTLVASNSCTACYEECGTCNSASACLTCVAANAGPNSANNVGCICNAGYWGVSPLTSANSCVGCYAECATCNQTNTCLTCISANAVPNTSTNIGCLCSIGYEGVSPLTSPTSCGACNALCLSCSNSTSCTSCKDPNSSPSSSFCSCKAGYWGTASSSTTSTCTACSGDCATCSSSQTCLTCVGVHASPNPSTLIGCLCNADYYASNTAGSALICTQCYLECSTCSSSNSCLTCISANASPNTSTNIGCSCNSGFWGTGPLSSSSSCVACYPECASCAQANTCLTCLANNAIPDASTSIGCVCAGAYWGVAPLTSASSCTACSSECATCTNSTACLTCKASNSLPSTASGGLCSCSSGYWGTSPLNTSTSCAACTGDCATCTSAQTCLTCTDPNAVPNAAPALGCLCNPAYYNSSASVSTLTCAPCNPECTSCNTANTCLSCLSANSVPDTSTGIGCICMTGYWGLSPLTSLTSCALCYSECATCSQANMCLTCTSPNAVPDTSTNIGCVCAEGYWGTSPLTSAASCSLCESECSTCSNSSACLTCKDPNAGPLVTSAGLCACNSGYWGNPPLTTNASCTQCTGDCSTCTSALTCLSCKDPNAAPNTSTGIGCLCNAKFYNAAAAGSAASCAACNADCATCANSTACTSCIDPNASPAPSGTGCLCNPGFSGLSPLNTSSSCTACSSQCATCGLPAQCLTCKDPNAVPDPSTGTGCLCQEGYYNASLATGYSCQACAGDCSSCADPSICLTCIAANSTPVATGGCSCSTSYYNTSALNSSSACILNATTCDVSCLDCSGPYKYQCTNCSNYYSFGYCVSQCPIGYTPSGGNCTAASTNTSAILLTFSGTGGPYYDPGSNVTAYALPSGSQRMLQSTVPSSVYGRGIYFPGSGFLKVNTTKELMLGGNFSFTAWVNPNSSSGALVYKGNSTFVINILALFVNFGITTDVFYNFTSTSPMSINQWNHFLITVGYSTYTTIVIALNDVQNSVQSLSLVPFLDSANSSMYLGYSPVYNITYIGFIYTIGIYSASPSISTLVTTSNCTSCSACPADGVCISSCSANSYYSETTKQCVQCPSSCTSGCLNSQSCGLCVDQYCVSCSSFSPNSCTQCSSGYMVQNSLCVACNYSSYYDSASASCIPCQGLCDSCSSNVVCITCVPNSALANDYSCQCMQGYSGDNCGRNLFNATLSVDQENNLTVTFSEALGQNLVSSEVAVAVNSSQVSFSIFTISTSVYKIVLGTTQAITGNTKVQVVFVTAIVSAANSLLSTTTLSSNLFASETAATVQATKVKAAAAKATAKTGTTAGSAVSLALSLMNFSPASIFDFLNTAEILYSAYLLNIEMPLVLSEFLMGLRSGVLSNFPNAFTYIISQSKGVPLNSKMQAYGYNTNLMILNSGPYMTVLSVGLIMLVICLLLGLKPWCKNKLKRVIKYYRYGFFLRFWVQTFLEILTCCCVGIKYSELENTTQVVDFCFCAAFIVRDIQAVFITGIGFLLHLIRTRMKLHEHEEIETFQDFYGEVFEEFKEEGVSTWIFYLLYVLRRLAIVISFMFIQSEALQLSIYFVSALSVIDIQVSFYVLATRNFKIFIYNIYHVPNELMIASYGFIMLLQILPESKLDWNDTTDKCMEFITVCWVMNMVCSTSVSLYNLYIKIRDWIRKRRAQAVSRVYSVKTVEEHEDNRTRTVDLDI